MAHGTKGQDMMRQCSNVDVHHRLIALCFMCGLTIAHSVLLVVTWTRNSSKDYSYLISTCNKMLCDSRCLRREYSQSRPARLSVQQPWEGLPQCRSEYSLIPLTRLAERQLWRIINSTASALVWFFHLHRMGLHEFLRSSSVSLQKMSHHV